MNALLQVKKLAGETMRKKISGLVVSAFVLLQSCGYYSPWLTERVPGADSSTGTYTSLALDSKNNPHIIYCDTDTKQLRHSYKDSWGWHTETVDGTESAGALAMDSGDVLHVSYRDSTTNNLKYGYRDAAGWHLATVDNEGLAAEYSSIALDFDGQPHIVYVNNIQNTSGHYQEYYYYKSELKYAVRDSAGWHIETAVSTEWQTAIRFLSLALDYSNTPHISCYRYTDPWPHSRPGWGRLLYIHNNSSEWTTDDVDPDEELAIGSYNSIAVDPENTVHISYCRETYQDYEKDNLKYAMKDGAGWHIEIADSATGVGKYTSLDLDAHNNPCISYYDEFNKDLKYAFQDLSGWHLETVDSGGGVGSYTALALDSRGIPHISYYDATDKTIKYARRAY
jgi:hypothetical protein